MEAKTKKLIFFLGSIFVAIIFLTSYAAFSNNGTNSTTTTIKSQSTVFATGVSSAVVYNYGDVAYVSLLNSSNSSRDALTNSISQLESMGNVQNYIETNGSYQLILSSNISSYGLQQWLYGKIGSNTVSVGSDAEIILPSSIQLYYNNAPLSIQLPNRNYSIYLSNVVALNSTINITISALLLRNGSIYGNQFRVSLAPKGETPTNSTGTNSTASNSISNISNANNTTVPNSTINASTTNSTSLNGNAINATTTISSSMPTNASANTMAPNSTTSNSTSG